jgi:hypothetical protein
MTQTQIKHPVPRVASDIKSTLGRRYAEAYGVDEYKREYNKGWAGGRRAQDTPPRAWENGTSSDAYDDGYLDAAAGRSKWHLTNCPDHENPRNPDGCLVDWTD